jgi:hypothetical protein
MASALWLDLEFLMNEVSAIGGQTGPTYGALLYHLPVPRSRSSPHSSPRIGNNRYADARKPETQERKILNMGKGEEQKRKQVVRPPRKTCAGCEIMSSRDTSLRAPGETCHDGATWYKWLRKMERKGWDENTYIFSPYIVYKFTYNTERKMIHK